MLEKHEARDRLLKCLNKGLWKSTEKRIIMDELTIERPYGWVFFCQSKLYLETKNPDLKLDTVGDGAIPVIVEKHDGTMTSLRSTYKLEKRIRGFEIRRFGASDYGTSDEYY